MTFIKPQQPTLIGGKIWGGQYNDALTGSNKITTVFSLHYLRVFITANLHWEKHINIMVNHAQSTIRGINILGNSIHGLDFIN